ncbi:MAG: hypothetical protein HKN81_08400 [Gammaproteobacteria bacterium]|nr:hypothetical protein [Gammaproteobacteria bacterium]
MNKLIGTALGTALLAIALAGCGGGSSGGTQPGIDRLGVRAGTVTGFGSIFVGDDRFEVDNAEFEVDDDSSGSGQDDLNIGDTVIVTFDPATPGVAQTVFSDDAVEGPIDSIDLAGSRLVVAGQTVIVDALTSFDDSIPTASLAGLAVDDVVEVNGFFDAVGDDQDGQIRATRIEPRLPGGEIEVKGLVEALDTNARTFSINSLDVDYGAVPADIDDSFPNMTFVEGDFVEVKGRSFSADGELLATKIEPDGPGVVDDGTFDNFDEVEAEIEGFITRFVSVGDFDVSGFPVDASGATFEGGVAGDLGLNVKVEVDGDVVAGVLIATEVDIRRSNDLRVAALVDEVDAAGGTLVVLGITVAVDGSTRREDKIDAELEPFGLAQLNVNDYVEVRGGADASGAADILASILERDDPPDVLGEETELRGFVDGIARPSFTIAGVTIATDGGTVFRDALEQVISADAFFNALRDGDLVDVDGTEMDGPIIVAEEVELED